MKNRFWMFKRGATYYVEDTVTGKQISLSNPAHVSDYLVNAMQIGSSGEHFVPPLNAKAWETLRLSTDALPRLVATIDEQLEAVQEVFLNGAKEDTGK